MMIENPTKNAKFIADTFGLLERGERSDRKVRALDEAPGLLLPERKLGLLGGRGILDQFQLDAALWYGAIKLGPYSHVLRTLFHIFYYAGVIYWAGKHWADWAFCPNANVASLLSHGQRVLVQIPTVQNGGGELWDFLNFIKAQRIPSRAFATHGLSREQRPFRHLIAGHTRKVREEETGGGAAEGQHYGFNVALGGKGNRNPVSAANNDEKHTYVPIMGEGLDGHVYINYLPPSQTEFGGMLVGCENAAPGRGKNPHTRAGHSLFGFGQDVSACGGMKWKDWKRGPKQEHNGLICDLTDRDRDLDWLLYAERFDEDWLDRPTRVVEPVAVAAPRVGVAPLRGRSSSAWA
jgi:hypothetical protein